MAALKTFLFDYDFDDAKLMEKIVEEETSKDKVDDTTTPPEPEIVPPTFSESELNAARQEGFNSGKENGKLEALSSIENSMNQVLNTIANEIMHLSQKQSEFNEQIKIESISLLIKIISRLFPLMNERLNLDETIQFSQSVLPELLSEPRITFRVNTEIAETLRKRIEPILNDKSYGGELMINGDTSLPTGTCIIEWSSGSAERNTELLLSEIEKLFVTAIDNDLFTKIDHGITSSNSELQPVASLPKDEASDQSNEMIEDAEGSHESLSEEEPAPQLHQEERTVEENTMKKETINDETDENP